MAYVELHGGMPGHAKTSRLMRELKIPRALAVGHLACAWSYCIERHPGGLLRADEFEAAAEWEGATGALLDAALLIRWLDRRPDGMVYLHDWQDYTRQYRKSKADYARMKDRASAESAQNTRRIGAESAVTGTEQTGPEQNGTGEVTAPDPVEADPLKPGPGWSPNRDAVHLAQRWSQINAKGICSPEKASQFFQAGLDAGLDPKALMAAVEANKGRKPFEIVDALKPRMAGTGPRNFADEAAARAERSIPTAAQVAAEKDAAYRAAQNREASLTADERAANKKKLDEARKKLGIT